MRKICIIFMASIILFVGYSLTKIELIKPKIDSFRVMNETSSKVLNCLQGELDHTMHAEFKEHLTNTLALSITSNYTLLNKYLEAFKEDLEIAKPSLTSMTYNIVNNYIDEVVKAKTDINNLQPLKKQLKEQLGDDTFESLDRSMNDLIIYDTFNPKDVLIIHKQLTKDIQQVKSSLSDTTYKQLQGVLNHYSRV